MPNPPKSILVTAQTSLIAGNKETSVRGFFVSTAEASLLDSVLRLTRLLDTPQDIPMLTPMIIREIYYRLLIGEQCEAVRQIATSGSNMQRIAQVIQYIKTDFTQPLRIDDLADRANMSPSSFYHHFKQVTLMSPLNYQKQWNGSYFVASCGGVTVTTLRKYIEEQDKPARQTV